MFFLPYRMKWSFRGFFLYKASLLVAATLTFDIHSFLLSFYTFRLLYSSLFAAASYLCSHKDDESSATITEVCCCSPLLPPLPTTLRRGGEIASAERKSSRYWLFVRSLLIVPTLRSDRNNPHKSLRDKSLKSCFIKEVFSLIACISRKDKTFLLQRLGTAPNHKEVAHNILNSSTLAPTLSFTHSLPFAASLKT